MEKTEIHVPLGWGKQIVVRLVDGWKRSWTWFSTQAMTLALLVQGAWLAMPEDLRAAIKPSWVFVIAIALLVLGIVGRMVDQSPPDDAKTE